MGFLKIIFYPHFYYSSYYVRVLLGATCISNFTSITSL